MSKLITAALVLFVLFQVGYSQGQVESKLKIDPALFLYVEECKNIMQAVGDKIWRDWDFSKTPILFYRPNVQDVLINYPHQPEGFAILAGFNPLKDEKVYFRDGATYIPYDGQNTSKEIDGIRTLVVADTYSNQKTQIRGVILGRDKDYALKWLDDWNFLPNDPYAQMAMILHEGFHVFQTAQAPDKKPNETAAIDYPLLDTPNNSSWALEAALMRDALLSESRDTRAAKIRELVAVRTERRAALNKESVDYEDLTEYLEGLAKYIEFRFLKEAQALEPDPRLFFINGFYGFGPKLKETSDKTIKRIKDIIAASIDMTGNKFGVGPLKYRLYSSGAAVALLLDDVAADWKADIFKGGVYLFDKLKKAVSLTAAEQASLVSQAKNEYGYETLSKKKRQFEEEGRRVLSDKLKSILETGDTLVVLDYSDSGVIAGLAFTPFGVSKVAENLTIYDMVPLSGRFTNKAEFRFAKVIPVLIDKAAKQMKFVVKTKTSAFEAQKGNEIKVEEFSLTGSRYELKATGNKILIKLLK